MIAPAEMGMVGKIPIRNLWLLMLYASDLFRHLGPEKIKQEENPDDIPDLVAEILAAMVERRLRRNLSPGYIDRELTLDRVRGRIDLLKTERGMLLARGKVACRFEELTVDTPRNQYVRAALRSIAGLVRDASLQHRCRVLAGTFDTLGVSSRRPSESEMSTDRLGRHDAEDARMLAAARLSFDLALPTELAGSRSLVAPDRDESWLRTLFEKAVGGFYRTVLDGAWNVLPGKEMRWPVEARSAGFDAILPKMKSDVVLVQPASSTKFVIDTKFTQMLVRGQHGNERLRSGYVYQIYAYARVTGGTGVLLHPSVGVDIYEAGVFHGHEFRFVTVDLTAGSAAIRQRLLAAIEVPAPVPMIVPF